jgi:SAM-dependent methyltransferase
MFDDGEVTDETRPDLRLAFNSIAEHYGEVFADRPGQLAAGAWLLERLAGLPHQPIILDIGCGTGTPTARQLVEGGAAVIGIDTSPVMIDLARHNVPDGIFIERDLSDLEGLHPAGARFDAAVAFFSLLVLPRSQVRETLAALHHVLVPAGLFALAMVEGDSDFLLREFLGAQVPLTAYPRAELAALLDETGFDVLEQTAEQFRSPIPGVPEQTHLYLRCTRR